MLLIGNNRYDVDLFTLGMRERLDEGVLQLWAAAGWLPTAWEEHVAASSTSKCQAAACKLRSTASL